MSSDAKSQLQDNPAPYLDHRLSENSLVHLQDDVLNLLIRHAEGTQKDCCQGKEDRQVPRSLLPLPAPPAKPGWPVFPAVLFPRPGTPTSASLPVQLRAQGSGFPPPHLPPEPPHSSPWPLKCSPGHGQRAGRGRVGSSLHRPCPPAPGVLLPCPRCLPPICVAPHSLCPTESRVPTRAL